MEVGPTIEIPGHGNIVWEWPGASDYTTRKRSLSMRTVNERVAEGGRTVRQSGGNDSVSVCQGSRAHMQTARYIMFFLMARRLSLFSLQCHL